MARALELLQRASFVVQSAMQAVVASFGGGNGDPAEASLALRRDEDKPAGSD
jgi:hypothetical protein